MKQCPQCRRAYDDSQNFCLMDGTALINEPEEETVVKKTNPPPKKKRWLIGFGIAALLVGFGIILLGGLFIYNFIGQNENTKAKNENTVKSSPARTSSPTPKTSPTNQAANASTNTEPSPEPENSPAANTDSEDEVTPIDWTTTATGFKNEVGMTYKFECPPDGKEAIVWGSDIYTADSSICTAAVHAGLFSLADGGIVTIEYRPGRTIYGSTTRNGIKSHTYGEFGRSFVVR